MKHKITFFLLCYVLFLGMPSIVYAEETQLQKEAAIETACKPFTVMVYMVGSNLESEQRAATADIMEMQAVLSDELEEKINVVITYGGCRDWGIPQLAESEARCGRFRLSSKGIVDLQKLPSVNMGETETLTSFVKYSITEYPAQRYILILWDHGNGPIEGFGYDECYGGDGLTLGELGKALSQPEFADISFEMIGFDACLMGNLETAYALPNNVAYMTASAEREPVGGWNYEWLNVLREESVRGSEIGNAIIDTYFADDSGNSQIPMTLAVFDLDMLQEFGVAFGVAVQKQLAIEGADNYFRRITEERCGYYSYDNKQWVSRRAELIDISYLIMSLHALPAEEREQLNSMLKQAVTAQMQNTAKDIHAVSIYLPNKGNILMKRDCTRYAELSFIEAYQFLVQQYCRYLLQGGKRTVIEAYSASYMLLPDSLSCIVLTEQTEAVITEEGMFADDNQEYLLLNGEIAYYRILYETEEYEEILCPVLYQQKPVQLCIRIEKSTGHGSMLGIYPVSDGNKTDRPIRELQPETILTLLYPMYAVENERVTEITGASYAVMIEEQEYLAGKQICIQKQKDMNISKRKTVLKNTVNGLFLTDDKQNESYILKKF